MGLRVGVTAVGAVANRNLALWSSGVTQNVVFLALLLGKVKGVKLSALVACPDGALGHPLGDHFGLPVLNEADAVERLDVIIELGARGSTDGMVRFRARGGKLVSYMAGNVVAMNFEAVACGVPHGEIMSESGYDAVWITPQHWRMNRSYAALTRCKVVEQAPHIWSPLILEQSATQFGADIVWRPDRSPRAWRLGVFDPNVNVVKTFHLPLFTCEEAYRRRPGLIDRVLMFSTEHLKGGSHFEELCATTELARTGRLFAEGRFPLAEMLGSHIDAVVTHQWENGLNYLYWDVLHTGWPLIHNAPDIADVGYYYRDFDPQDGARALIDALDHHAETFARQRPRINGDPMAKAYRQSGGSDAARRALGTVAAIALVVAASSEPAGLNAAPRQVPKQNTVAQGMGQAPAPPDERLAAALSQVGMTTCAAAVKRAAHFLFEDGDANFTVQPLGPDVNRWPTVIVIEGAHAAMGKTRLTTLTASPGPGCAGFYEQVIYWPTPCAKLKSTVFSSFQSPHPLFKDVQASELNAGLQLYLLPSGEGCTSVKKELFH